MTFLPIKLWYGTKYRENCCLLFGFTKKDKRPKKKEFFKKKTKILFKKNNVNKTMLFSSIKRILRGRQP